MTRQYGKLNLRWSGAWIVLASLVASSWTMAEERPRNLDTALDRYIAQPDDSYAWKVIKTVPGDGLTTYIVDLKSQTWRTSADVDRTLWEHWLIVTKPDKVDFDTAFVMIGGGRNGGDPPDSADAFTLAMARDTNSVVAELKMVPNQPLDFGDGVGRVEDDLIAYTWDKFMTTGDETWPARLPMVKSVVRAMDTIQALLASEEGGGHSIEQFVVAGGSKRGWTTWLTGAADKRVAAIIPIVIDVVNVRVSMQHHYEAYGFWAPAVTDYVRHKITDRQNAPEYIDLLKIEDPYSYLRRYTMPKFVVNASGDEFFLPDSSQFYYDDLPGEKCLRYVANGNHSLRDTDAPQSIQAYYETVLNKTPRPDYSWKLNDDGSIRVETKQQPAKVLLWQATNRFSRDFRLDAIGRAYTSQELEPQEDGSYLASVDVPAKGWTAFFVELTYDVGATYPLKVTTQVSVVPDTLPHAGKLPPLTDGN